MIETLKTEMTKYKSKELKWKVVKYKGWNLHFSQNQIIIILLLHTNHCHFKNCEYIYIYIYVRNVNGCLKNIDSRIIFKIFNEKMINQLIFLKIFYISQENSVKIFLIWFINNFSKTPICMYIYIYIYHHSYWLFLKKLSENGKDKQRNMIYLFNNAI